MKSSFIAYYDTILLFFVLLLFVHGECTNNVNCGSKLLDHFRDASENSHRLIDLKVGGRMKCLLWNNPVSSLSSTLTPLFSSEEVDVGEKRDQTRLQSSFSPSAVFTTAEYSFRKERWYGLKKFGILLRWNFVSPLRHSNHDGFDNNERNDNIIQPRSKERRIPSFPTMDVTAGHFISSPSNVNDKMGNNFAGFGNLRLGWTKYDNGNYDVGVGDENIEPWIQIGFDPDHTTSSKGQIRKINDRSLHLKFFLPLVLRRFNLQWTSRWNHNTNVAATRSSAMKRQLNDDLWWIPELRLDPSSGTVSSENRYHNSYIGEEQEYRAEFKLRVRTKMPTLLSTATNYGMTTLDDNDDYTQTVSLRLDCSFLKVPVEQNRDYLDSTITTARLDMDVVPSCWWRSVTETARVGFIHEQNHANFLEPKAS